MADPLQQRVNEKKIYEEIVNIIVDYVYKEFSDDEKARLRVYAKIAENFDGMVRSLSPPSSPPTLLNIIEKEDTRYE
jgi:hypothetical protein